MKPMFSLIHPSARPEKWQAIYDAWHGAANEWSEVEYILVCDRRWGFDQLPEFPATKGFRAVWNTGRRCYVDAVNIGAQYATGEVLIVAADDQFPCEGWDLKLAEVLADSGKEVIEISTGTPTEHERGILVMPILTRARYERLGYLLYPEYESMFADNDFCEMARRDDQIADARHLIFLHKHPFFDSTIETDEAYKAQNRPEAYQIGGTILAARRVANFGSPSRKRIVVCLPGERFSMRWVQATLRTLGLLQSRFDIDVVMGYCSNVFATRSVLALEACEKDADYVLWIDDDNPVEPEHVLRLIGDLEAIREIDVVVGWCLCHSDGFESPVINTSVGLFTEGIRQRSIPPADLDSATAIMKIDWSGFPVVLMRQSVLKRFGRCFEPMPNEDSSYGFDSEDLSFSRRLKEAGLNLAVDPRVKVPHLKLRDTNSDVVPATAGILKGAK